MKAIKLGILALSICSSSLVFAEDYRIDNIPVQGLLYYDRGNAPGYFQNTDDMNDLNLRFALQKEAFENYVNACRHFQDTMAPSSSANFISASCTESDPRLDRGGYATNRGWRYYSDSASVLVDIPDGKSVVARQFQVGGVETPDRAQAIGTYFEDCMNRIDELKSNPEKAGGEFVFAHCGWREETGSGRNFYYNSQGTYYILQSGNWWDNPNKPTPTPTPPPSEPPTPVQPPEACDESDKDNMRNEIAQCKAENNINSQTIAEVRGEINALLPIISQKESTATLALSQCEMDRTEVNNQYSIAKQDYQALGDELAQASANNSNLNSELSILREAAKVKEWECTVLDGKRPGESRKRANLVPVVNKSKVIALKEAMNNCLKSKYCKEHGYDIKCIPVREGRDGRHGGGHRGDNGRGGRG